MTVFGSEEVGNTEEETVGAMISSTHNAQTTTDVAQEAVEAAPSSGVTKPSDTQTSCPCIATIGDAVNSSTTLVSDEEMSFERGSLPPVMETCASAHHLLSIPIIETITNAVRSKVQIAVSTIASMLCPGCYGTVMLLTLPTLLPSRMQLNQTSW